MAALMRAAADLGSQHVGHTPKTKDSILWHSVERGARIRDAITIHVIDPRENHTAAKTADTCRNSLDNARLVFMLARGSHHRVDPSQGYPKTSHAWRLVQWGDLPRYKIADSAREREKETHGPSKLPRSLARFK